MATITNNKKRTLFILLLLFPFIAGIGMFTFLSFSKKLFLSEKKVFAQFIDHVMIRQSGIYTLMDFKPISLIDMSYIPPSKEEKYKIWHDFPDKIKLKHSVNDVFFPSYNCQKILNEWQKIEQKFVGSKYRFISTKKGNVYFINIPLALSTIQEHFNLFKTILNSDISEEEVLLSIGDSSSELWKRIEQGHVLRGVLFGYGMHNSLNFEKFLQGNPDIVDSSISSTPSKVAIEEHPKITSLNIPPFRVFEGGEDQLEKFKKKRMEILSECEKENFYSLTKRYLKQNYP